MELLLEGRKASKSCLFLTFCNKMQYYSVLARNWLYQRKPLKLKMHDRTAERVFSAMALNISLRLAFT